MKKITYGEDLTNNTGNKIEALESNDILSARTLNRPFINAQEEVEAKDVLLQSLLKTIYGGTELKSIIVPAYEKFCVNNYMEAEEIFDGNNSIKVLRIPTGIGLFKYTIDEDEDIYDIYNENSYSVINRPNCELFERELAEHYGINLNDLDNDIKVSYTINGSEINYTVKYNFGSYSGTLPESPNPGTPPEPLKTMAQVVKAFDKKFGNINVKKDTNFNLEEVIPCGNYTPEIGHKIVFDCGCSGKADLSSCKKSNTGRFILVESGTASTEGYLTIFECKSYACWSFGHENTPESGIQNYDLDDRHATIKDATITNSLNVLQNATFEKDVTIIKDAYANSFNATSAREKKTDIVPTTHKAVEEINKIEVVDFYFKTDTEKKHKKVGFIADDTDPVFSVDNKHFDITNTVGMLLKAVQELSEENKKLKVELDDIKRNS